MPKCQKCKRERDVSDVEIIDGEVTCHECLYENHDPFKIFPIGFVENNLTRGAGFGVKGNRGDISKIHLFASQKRFLYKLEDEKWICVVFYLNKQREIRSTFHRGIDGKKVGVFASRTPDRLSQIGITNVELVKIEGKTLHVKNFDAINGTPVLDIKLGSKSRW